MPSKDLICDFCKITSTKQKLASHVKAKHIKELGEYILEEYIKNPDFNTLERYAKCINPTNIPIYSKTHNEGRYFFGANPTFFEDSDDATSYIKSDENMKIHNEFLEEIIKNISMSDYIKAERIIKINSPETRKLISDKNELEKQNKILKEQVETLEKSTIYLQDIVKDYKEATECSSTISDMKVKINDLNGSIAYYEKQANIYQAKCKELSQNQDNSLQELMEEYNRKIFDTNNQLDNYIAINSKLKTELEAATVKRESIINNRLEKEIKKVEEKHNLEIKKIKEKYTNKIETFEEEIDLLKMENKRIKRKAKITLETKSKPDSDSDSD